MDERTHDVFADTSLQLVTLPDDDDGIIVVVAEATHALYDEKHLEGRNYLSHVPPSQLSVYENPDGYLSKKAPLDGDIPIKKHGKSKDKPLVVEVPEQRVSVALSQANDSREMNDLIEYSRGNLSGVPSDFRTIRSATVKKFYDLLFPEDGKYLPLLFISAPPMSGKTAMLHLLNNYILRSKPDAMVSFIQADKMQPGERVVECFERLYKRQLERFSENDYEKVILIDGAELTFDDYQLWVGYVKDVLDWQPDLRFVMFCSYGNCETFPKSSRWGEQISIPPHCLFGQEVSPSRPGLRLSQAELDEMVSASSVAQLARNFIWDLSSGHVGIAHAMLRFLHDEFEAKPVSVTEIELALRSAKLFEYIWHTCRGIPTVQAVNDMIVAKKLEGEDVYFILEEVAFGKAVSSSERGLLPQSRETLKGLVQYGFLYADQNEQLQFASNMHLKIWLYSSQPKPTPPFVLDLTTQTGFVRACVRRMRSSRLQWASKEAPVFRERQLQMELYRAIVSCVPEGKAVVSPERSMTDGKRHMSVVVCAAGVIWYWELHCCEEDEHIQGDLEAKGSKYALVDFRPRA